MPLTAMMTAMAVVTVMSAGELVMTAVPVASVMAAAMVLMPGELMMTVMTVLSVVPMFHMVAIFGGMPVVTVMAMMCEVIVMVSATMMPVPGVLRVAAMMPVITMSLVAVTLARRSVMLPMGKLMAVLRSLGTGTMMAGEAMLVRSAWLAMFSCRPLPWARPMAAWTREIPRPRMVPTLRRTTRRPMAGSTIAIFAVAVLTVIARLSRATGATVRRSRMPTPAFAIRPTAALVAFASRLATFPVVFPVVAAWLIRFVLIGIRLTGSVWPRTVAMASELSAPAGEASVARPIRTVWAGGRLIAAFIVGRCHIT
jgi:hypothetical protein